jgi:hypothetical protein
VLGGAASVAGGGKFANGAVTGAFAYLIAIGATSQASSSGSLMDANASDNSLNLGEGYSGRVDSFNGPGGQASFEIHVYDSAGNEVGVWGPEGWINKHAGIPEEVSPQLENTLRGMSIDQLRASGLIPDKGQADIKNVPLPNLVGRFLLRVTPPTFIIDSVTTNSICQFNPGAPGCGHS